MRKFLSEIVLFILIVAFIGELMSLSLVYVASYRVAYPGVEIYRSIRKSKRKGKAKKVILGDSVGNQLFSNTITNDSINSLACNQAIGMVGHFLLLNNYIEAGNKLDVVYMVFSPTTFGNNLNQTYTFHYFLKPFSNSEYRHLFTETVYQQIQKIPYNYLSNVPHIRASTWAPEFKPADTASYTFLSPITIEYLQKIKRMASENEFKLVIVPAPVSESKREWINTIDLSEIVLNGFEEEFENYFSSMMFLDHSYFSDQSHLKNPDELADKYRVSFIR